MLVTMTRLASWAGTGDRAVVLTVTPETPDERVVANCIPVGVPPEGNIIGWLDDIKVLIEVAEA